MEDLTPPGYVCSTTNGSHSGGGEAATCAFGRLRRAYAGYRWAVRVGICEWTTFPASFEAELAAYGAAGAGVELMSDDGTFGNALRGLALGAADRGARAPFGQSLEALL